jgi:hypothetical protein
VLLSVAASYTATLLTGTSPQSPAAALTAGYRLALVITAALSAIGAVVAALTLRPDLGGTRGRTGLPGDEREARAEEVSQQDHFPLKDSP